MTHPVSVGHIYIRHARDHDAMSGSGNNHVIAVLIGTNVLCEKRNSLVRYLLGTTCR